MRILQLVQKPQRRGAEMFAFQLSKEVRARGHAVRIAYLYPHGGTGGLPLGEEDEILEGQVDHPLERLPGWHPGLLRRVAESVDAFGPDVVQVNGARTVKYGALVRRRKRGKPFALIYRNIGDPADWVRGVLRRTFYRRLVFPWLDGIVAVSENSLQRLRDFYPLEAVALEQIPRGVDPEALSPRILREELRRQAGTPGDAQVIVFVGSLTLEKRLDRLLRVFRRVLAELPDARLWILGEGPLRSEMEREATELGLLESIHLLGVKEDVGSFLGAADLLLLTSDTEGTPGVVLEAGAVGTPAVATRVGGVAECVVEGETGLLAEATDEEGLARNILELLRQPDRRRALGAEAARWVRERFSIQEVARRYLDFYRLVIESRARAR